jgi:adenylate cyclase
LAAARRRAINLPWWVAVISGAGWGCAVPVFLMSLALSPTPLAPQAAAHLGISLSIGGMIAVTQSAFVVELAAHRWLFPVLFQTVQPAGVADALPLTLRGRGVMWAVSAGVCPVVVLLLLILAPDPSGTGFALTVAAFAVAFALSTAWLLGATIAKPVRELSEAARRVTAGDLSTRVDLVRADEFGLLITAFNQMVCELREKQSLMETFGRHVGRDAADMILQRDPHLGGVEQTVTVMFADIRNFTARCAGCSAQQTVAVLNAFFSEMVEAVENENGGMVNKFVGDGFLALFGAASRRSNHSEMAVQAARRMLERLGRMNEHLQQQGYAPVEIGIGIHTGLAVVGSIGSPRRRDFTAIGDTVNVASRVESLTKNVGETILITAPTRAALPPDIVVRDLPPQMVKGKDEPIVVYGVDTANEGPQTR